MSAPDKEHPQLMSSPNAAAIDLDVVADGLAVTIILDEPLTGALQVRIGGQSLRRALAPTMALAANDVRVAEAERIAELLHARRSDVISGAVARPNTYFAGMVDAALLACAGGHPGAVHGDAHRAAVARAALVDLTQSPDDPDRAQRHLRAAMAQIAALSDAAGARPEGWNEAISEVSLLLSETLAAMPDARED